MKKLLTTISMAGALLAPNLYASVEYNGTITMYSSSEQSGNGGAFEAVTTPTVPASVGTLVPGSQSLGTFLTFCIEMNEEISFGGTYYYDVNTGAVADSGDSVGFGHIDSHNSLTYAPAAGLGATMDNISIGTAWLYSQYRNGSLSGYNYGTAASGGSLQNAIWYLEGEITLAQLSTFNGNNGTAFFDDALTAAGNDQSTDSNSVFADATGAKLHGVEVLNLYNADGSLAQDQLAIVPEPTTMLAGALLLLPFGASTLRILRKNRTS